MKEVESSIKELANYINEADIICFYGGAGTSTESGIPDYRSKYGIWTKMKEQDMNPQYFASYRRLLENPKEFFRVRKSEGPAPQPNDTHKILADLEKNGKDIRVITQNVDGLHQKAGHRFVLELHGDSRNWYCMDCGRIYGFNELERDEDGVPRCYVDNGIVRPNVVYFGESVERKIVDQSKNTLQKSDLLIIAGTSLTTGLAKRLVNQFKGEHIVIVNKEPLKLRNLEADLFIQKPIGEVLRKTNPLIK